MELIDHLRLGFATALTLHNLAYALAGCTLGTLVGVLPGIGPVSTLAMLLPLTYAMGPTSALILLAGIYYGAQYGGSTAAILVNLPGEITSVVTCLDGHPMARQGRGGAALAAAALGSFFAGTVGTLALAALAAPMVELALSFGPWENLGLMVFGLAGAIALAPGRMSKAAAMVVLGMLLGTVGTDLGTGVARFSFGIPELVDRIDLVFVAIGMFGLAEVVANLAREHARPAATPAPLAATLTRDEFRRAWPASVRGTLVGGALGVLPGGGALLAAPAAYALEKRLARDPHAFGQGAIEGVAAPESANNAGAQTSFVPMLTLGIPPSPVMALMIGAMTIHDIQPGPQVMSSNPALFWGLVCSMWVGNLILVLLNLPLIGLWVRLLRVPYRWLYPAVLMLCAIGAYAIHNNPRDLYVAAAFGVAGVGLARLGCPPAPLLLGLILGPMVEENLRIALALAHGDWTRIAGHPLALGGLAAAAALLVAMAWPGRVAARRRAPPAT